MNQLMSWFIGNTKQFEFDFLPLSLHSLFFFFLWRHRPCQICVTPDDLSFSRCWILNFCASFTTARRRAVKKSTRRSKNRTRNAYLDCACVYRHQTAKRCHFRSRNFHLTAWGYIFNQLRANRSLMQLTRQSHSLFCCAYYYVLLKPSQFHTHGLKSRTTMPQGAVECETPSVLRFFSVFCRCFVWFRQQKVIRFRKIWFGLK